MPKLEKGTNQTVNSIVTAIGLVVAVLFGMSAVDGAELTAHLAAVTGGAIGVYGLIKSYRDERAAE